MLDGGRIRIRQGEIAFVNSSSSAPLFVSGKVGEEVLPQLISVYDSDVTNLHLSNIDVSSCLLYAAVGLSNVTIEMSVRFAKAPTFFSRRPVVADEYWVRIKKSASLKRWWTRYGPKTIIDGRDIDRSLPGPDLLPLLSFHQVAIVYRMLKRAQDSERNYAGGSEFFYGEMEMRRRSKEEGFANRFILTMYWFVSGYGLRAWRAFSFFGAIVILGAIVAHKYAFCGGDGTFSQALNFALRATIPGLRPVDGLSSTGRFLEIGLAVLGPIFFAMGAIALRARVRR